MSAVLEDGRETQWGLAFDDRVDYVHRAVVVLAKRWGQDGADNRGLRAIFRRWKPEADTEPTMEMRGAVWAYLGSPLDEPDEEGGAIPEIPAEKSRSAERLEDRVIDVAAIVVGLRAAAPEADQGASIGAALYRSGFSERRLVQLLTEKQSRRAASLHRALTFLSRGDGTPIGWNKREVATIINYLTGDERYARKAANQWAADYYRQRGKQSDKKKE